jgi:pimeloyl-ACP methyl ester carboxylesterase
MTKTEHGGKPLILFLHPIGLDRHVWSDVLVPGSTALDFPGHGMTRATGPVSMAGLADWVLGHISRPATLVGMSLGGMVAQQVAVRAPDAVASLVIACSSAASNPRMMRERAAMTRGNGMAGILETTLDRWFTPQARSTPGHPGVEYARQRLLADDPEIVAQYWEAMAGHDVTAQLSSVNVPVTFIAGAVDKASSLEVLQAMAEAVPGAELQVVDGPHILTLERPREFSAVFARHLNRVYGRSIRSDQMTESPLP